MSLLAHPSSGLLLVGSAQEGGTGLLAVDQSCCCNQSGFTGSEGVRCCDLGVTLTGTISNKTGVATALPDTVTMTQDGPVGTLRWLSNTFGHPCATGSSGFTLACDVNTNTWSLVGSGTDFTLNAVLVSADCDTKTVVFDVNINTTCGAGSFRITFQG